MRKSFKHRYSKGKIGIILKGDIFIYVNYTLLYALLALKKGR